MCPYGKIILLKRGAAEHEYPRARKFGDFRLSVRQKGIAAEMHSFPCGARWE